eukprot:m.867927 g.867927  ORF g.867927 m.867927 type:complete len:86 (+) comp23556_c1_seq4:2630-2887(+)
MLWHALRLSRLLPLCYVAVHTGQEEICRPTTLDVLVGCSVLQSKYMLRLFNDQWLVLIHFFVKIPLKARSDKLLQLVTTTRKLGI